ncbi:nucleotidyltransferase domain-containing protein [Desulfococcaceae bacterium HSG8]|nr:nucleotidyltransferase domain-containing protein [Desulfococcaceae bacterium HSG8]
MREPRELLISSFPNDIDKVILFGSRAKKNATAHSDYDILVVLKKIMTGN